MCRGCQDVPIHRILRQHECDLTALQEQIDLGHVNLRSPCGKSPLMTAAYYCHKKALAPLLEAGAVINAVHFETGDTPAHYVVLSMSGHIRQCGCIMVLLEYGASIDMQNVDGYTVFELATKAGNKDIGNTGTAMMRAEGEAE